MPRPRLASLLPGAVPLALALFAATAPAAPKPVVHATNYPLSYFADRIGGRLIDLQFLAPAGGDPAFWVPSDDAVASMQTADLILLNGATYSKWIGHVSLPESILLDTSAGFKDQFIETRDGVTHSHGKDGEHSHAGIAFTTWMDFTLAKQQATAVRDALLTILPDERQKLESNATKLFADIDELDAAFTEATTALRGVPLVASHPVYQYLARRYQLSLESVLWEPETVPTDEDMAALHKVLASHPAKIMIWEGEPAKESVAKLEAIGLSSIVVAPCGNRPGRGDWLSVMRGNLKALRTLPKATP